MQNNIIFKLKALQSVEPEEAWVVENKERLMKKAAAFGVRNDVILGKNSVYASKRKFGLSAFLPNHLAVSFTSLLIVLTSGALTVGASQSSLPGEPLYAVKKVGEQVALAIASEENKPKIEIEQAGKRLEELAQISQRTSDTEQHKKVEQLVAEFEGKVNSANNKLAELSDKGKADSAMKEKVVSAAQVVTEQSEKYSEVLSKTTDSMPESVKDKVATSVANAVTTTEKTNMSALLVIVETKKDDPITEDETAKIQKRIEKVEESLKIMEEDLSGEKACSEIELNAMDGTGIESCVSEEELNGKKTQVAEIRQQLEDAKSRMNSKDLVGSMGILTVLTEKIDNFGKQETAVVNETGTVAGANTGETGIEDISSNDGISQENWIDSGVVDGVSVSE